MRKIIVVVMMMAGVAFFMTSNASAALIAIGDPQLTGSWTQSFSKSGSYNFDRMDVHVIYGTKFKGEGLENLSNYWSGSLHSRGLFASYGGGETNHVDFNLHLDTDADKPFKIFFQSYYHGSWIDGNEAYWDGKKWHIHSECRPPKEVPEPSTVLLLGGGLVGLAGFGRKKFKK